jgi:glycolate oxidase iron-sulfur subunit
MTLDDAKDMLNDDLIVKCMHCGLCLPTCPTYVLTGMEKSSPRGRIRLMKAVKDGELEMTEGFRDEIDFCLDCQACETACPAGVKFGSLIESARSEIATKGLERWPTRLIKRFMFKYLFTDAQMLVRFAGLLRLYQKSGIDWLLKKTRLLRIFSKRLDQIQFLATKISNVSSRKQLTEQSLSQPLQKYRVGFLTGCIMDVAFADINMDTVKLLMHHNCEVVAPTSQRCCGSLQAHNGDMETARSLARRNVEAFSNLDLDAIVMNSAGCGAFMKKYGSVLEDESEYAAPALEMSNKIKDISEFLDDIGLKTNEALKQTYHGKRVTYHDACHLVHSQKIFDQPRKLIKSLPGIDYVSLPESTWCCGSAGIYNITHFDTSMQLLNRKIENIKTVEPDIIVTGNPGCLIQLEHGLRDQGLNIELLHLATFLRRACCE